MAGAGLHLLRPRPRWGVPPVTARSGGAGVGGRGSRRPPPPSPTAAGSGCGRAGVLSAPTPSLTAAPLGVWGGGGPERPPRQPRLPGCGRSGVRGGGSPGPGARWPALRLALGPGASFPTELRRPARLARGPLPACDARPALQGKTLFSCKGCSLRFCNRSPLHSAPRASSVHAGRAGARAAAEAEGEQGASRGRAVSARAGEGRGARADARRRPGGEKSRDGGPRLEGGTSPQRASARRGLPAPVPRPPLRCPVFITASCRREDTVSPVRACARAAAGSAGRSGGPGASGRPRALFAPVTRALGAHSPRQRGPVGAAGFPPRAQARQAVGRPAGAGPPPWFTVCERRPEPGFWSPVRSVTLSLEVTAGDVGRRLPPCKRKCECSKHWVVCRVRRRRVRPLCRVGGFPPTSLLP